MKILCLRFSSIGDIVLTTPVVRVLHEQLGHEVHFVTKKNFAPIMQVNPHVAKVYVFDKDIAGLIPELKAERYDHVIDLHHNLRSWRLKRALGRPSRSFDKLNMEKWLLVNTGIDLLPGMHIVDRYMATIAHLGGRYDGKGLDFFIPKDEEVDLSIMPGSLSADGFLAFVIGATHATKRLPAEKIVDIIERVSMPVVLLGGPQEEAAARWIGQQLAGRPVFDYCGRLSLMQSASVVRQAHKVITHDTGLMHIAAALGKEIVSVWGSTVPKFGMYPFFADGESRQQAFGVEGLRCRPCSKIGFDKCPKGHFRCMKEQSVEAIALASGRRSG